MAEVCDDINFSNLSVDENEKSLYTIIGHIEDILMQERFLEILSEFMELHWHEFEDTEVNKFVYTDIFYKYIETIEKYLEEELIKREPGFSMSKFEADLKDHHIEIEGEIFEMLTTFSDFCAFKTMMLDYRNMKEGKTADFSSDLYVSKYVAIEETAM